ncbi:hypothetical protein [Streptomyces anthocyanicus]|uniref:hypothetical protein n=1 Tax=Streptomyces anthocyanicus TaxID=68174 RepID=UPI0036DFB1AF|nr:hypothetical protein OH747_05740 [Streptomyces anthocyanicus]
MTRPIRDLDVPLSQLQQDMRRLVAQQRAAASAERLQLLLAHPEAAAVPASAGEQAEQRHWLYDADDDATTPAFPYPTTQEA